MNRRCIRGEPVGERRGDSAAREYPVPLLRFRFSLMLVFFAWMIVLNAALFFPGLLASILPLSAASIRAVSLGLGALTFFVAMAAIRCPGCRVSLAWFAIRRQPHDQWFSWLSEVSTCPVCRYSHPKE